MTSPPQQILLVGATGKQGSKVFKSLLEAGHPASSITCLTRNPASEAAQKIQAKGVQLVKGSLVDIPSLKEALKGKDAAFLGKFFTHLRYFPSHHSFLSQSDGCYSSSSLSHCDP